MLLLVRDMASAAESIFPACIQLLKKLRPYLQEERGSPTPESGLHQVSERQKGVVWPSVRPVFVRPPLPIEIRITSTNGA